MIKNITLNWHNPIAIQQIKQESIALKNGIYQISKKDKSEELLYIGLVKGETRNFYQRIQEHLQDKDELNNINIYVRFGIFDEKIIDDEIYKLKFFTIILQISLILFFAFISYILAKKSLKPMIEALRGLQNLF